MERIDIPGLPFLCLVCIYAAAALSVPRAECQQVHVAIDGRSPGRIYDGLGALSAGASSRLLIDYPEPQRSQILDYLFKPGYGASLQHLKVEVGADVNSTDGSEPSHMRSSTDHDYTRGYEWWLMAEAHQRNPGIILDILPWGAPGWVGGDHTLYTPAMAEYMADFIEGAAKQYRLKIRYAGVWNEWEYNAAYVKELHAALQRHHLDTKIVCCDEWPGEGKGQWAIAEAVQTDSELNSAVAVIGAHYPRDDGKITTTPVARQSGKPLWSSEDQPNSGGGPFVERTWAEGGRVLAHLYNRNYLEGSMTKTEIWSPITSYYDILPAPHSGLMYANTPWSGYYDVQSTIWVTAHTTQFAQPGWQYLDASSGNLPGKGTFVTLRSPIGGNWSMVLETIDATQAQTVNFSVMGGLARSPVHIWETNAHRSFEHVADIDPVDGAFSFAFEPDSLYTLTTTTGQGKGTAAPPRQRPFPLPYSDDFERTPLRRAPKYLSDQDGAFEVRPCTGRPGRCLEQVIQLKPIPWGPMPDPYTLAGDAAWTDYSVSADIRFLSESPVTLMGRVDSADLFQEAKAHLPSGYVLRLHPDGAWELFSTVYTKPMVTLGSGTAAIDRNQWHRLELVFRGTSIEARLDGASLARREDSGHAHGMFALGTVWDHAQFDNLRVVPIASQVP